MSHLPMGFLAEIKTGKTGGKALEKKKQTVRIVDPAKIFLQFDSSHAITFDDSRHHTAIFGTTGSGKTGSAIYAILNNAIKARDAVLLGDLKGTMGNDTRKLARIHGREADVVEYGSHELALILNSIAYMSDEGLREFLDTMADDNCPDSNGKIWAKKGAHMAADCAIILRILARHYKDFEPTLGRIHEMINNGFEASRIYTLFLENVYDKDDEKQRQLVTVINNNSFHIMKKLERDRNTKEFLPYNINQNTGKVIRDNYDEQVTWNLQAIRMGLRTFLEAPGIAEHFSAPGAPGIDLRSDIMSGKIIILRFDSLTGKTGTFLIRSLISEAYRIVLKSRIEERCGKLFHVILDEFQEFADFSDNAGSDRNFIALGREFGGSLTVATQSMSSLACKVGNPLAVESFIGNCNNILSFYSHDSSTQQLVDRYDRRILLNKLAPGKLFAVTYDSETRKHVHGVQKLDKAYREIRSLLDGIELAPEADTGGETVAAPSLTSITDAWLEDLERKKKEEEMEIIEERRAREELLNKLRAERDRQEGVTAQAMDDADDDTDADTEDVDDEDVEEEEDISEYMDSVYDEDDFPRGKSFWDDDSDTEMGAEKNTFASQLRAEFPRLFARGFKSADIPVGWREFTMKTLRTFMAIDLAAKIDELGVEDNNLIATLEEGSSFTESVLNHMLRPASSLCMICGQNMRGTSDNPIEACGSLNVPICGECQRKYNSVEVEPEKQSRSA